MELLAVSVGLGLVVSLLCTELFGIASAGLIVPGYLAIYITKPYHIAATLSVAFVTYLVVRILSSFMVVYGRRRTALMILFGYIFGMLLNQWAAVWQEEFTAIGFIIPGLIAIWMDRQNVIETVASLAIVTSIVRLILVLTMTAELLA